jgi:hypothetical protein
MIKYTRKGPNTRCVYRYIQAGLARRRQASASQLGDGHGVLSRGKMSLDDLKVTELVLKFTS